MSVGDIHRVDLPAANGREQRGRRPAVILQDDHYAGTLPVVLVVPLTTTRAAMRFAETTLIRPTAENGLRQVSVALTAVRAYHSEVPRGRFERFLGFLAVCIMHTDLTQRQHDGLGVMADGD